MWRLLVESFRPINSKACRMVSSGHFICAYCCWLTLSDLPIVVGSSVPKAKLISTRKGLTRKPIDQLEYLEDLDALAVLSGESGTIRHQCSSGSLALIDMN